MYKAIVTCIVLFLANFILNAQEFQGMAVYESKTSISEFKSRMEKNKELTPEIKKRIEERMKSMSEKTFILNFDKSASIYKEEEKLEVPTQGGGGGGGNRSRMMAAMTPSLGTYYKNVKEKSFVVDREFMGKEFLVKDSLSNLNWKMEAETRVIGGYNCFKATAVKQVSKTDFKNLTPKKEDATAAKPETETKKTSFMDALEMPKEVIVTAWYTPEIPVNQGPEEYWGLPGLILEVNDGKTVVLCSKVVLNPKVKAEIKAPVKGKSISQKEFDEVVLKKTEEYRSMYQGQSGNNGWRMGRN
jgi:GLPGLI family protein